MKFNTEPIHPDKIQLIQEMLSSPEVAPYYNAFVSIGHPFTRETYEAREKYFALYCKARDKFLGLPPLVIEPIQTTHARYRT